ncbi:MAG: PAS domain-containing protein [Candidatus Sedimenticola sp. (ex Thyasira tokunagai)]
MKEHNDPTGTVFSNSPCGILVLDGDGKISNLNQALSELVGQPPEQLIGHDCDTLPFGTLKGLFKGEGEMHLIGPGVGQEQWLHCTVHKSGQGGVIKFFVEVTEQVTLQEENERLRQQVKQLTLTDELTGLANQLELSRALNAQVTRSRRYGNPLSLAMMEVVDANESEQTLPDELIISTSRYLRDRLRWVDVIARWGHNQFVIILPETLHSDGYSLISKIQEEFPQAQLSEPAQGEALALRFGLAEWEKGYDTRMLMRRAASALTGEQEQMEQAS